MDTALIKSPAHKWVEHEKVIYSVLSRGNQPKAIAILKGKIFEPKKRSTNNVYAEGDARGFENLSENDVQPIGRMFADDDLKAMKLLKIVVMTAFLVRDNQLSIPCACSFGDGYKVETYFVYPHALWDYTFGFAFLVPESLFPQLRKLGLQLP